MSEGNVYILTNTSMPGLVKIGRTCRSVEQRAMELHQTGVAMPFQIHTSVFSPDCATLEANTHGLLYRYRISGNREFFRVEAESAAADLRTAHADQLSHLIERFADQRVIDAIFSLTNGGAT